MEKCAVALASPISTMLSATQRSQRMVGKLRQIERLVMSRWPCSSSANKVSTKRADASSSSWSRPARTNVSRIGLDDPGRALRLVLVAMGDEDAVLGLAEEEREGIERPRRAHPGEEVRPQIDARLEPIGKGVAHARIDAVRHHHEIGVADRRIERRDFRLVLDLDAERARAPAQNLQQRPARAAAEAVAADAVGGAAEMDLDVVPVGKVADDGAIALAVVAFERVERLVGEHHAEAEGIVGPVALEHGDARLRPCLLHQDREIEPGRAAADHVNFHARLHRSRSRPRRAVPIRHPEVPAPWRASKDDGHTRPAPEPSPTEVRLAPRGDGYRARRIYFRLKTFSRQA